MMFVKQRAPSDCAICAISMATNKPYEEVLQAAGSNYGPTGTVRLYEILKTLGYMQTYRTFEGSGDFKCLTRDWAISSDFFRLFSWARRSILMVPSQTMGPNKWHSVYYDGERVWDPSTIMCYTKWEELRPEEIILFNETQQPSA